LFGGRASVTKEVSANGTLQAAYNLEYGYTIAQPALLCAVFTRCDQAGRDQISRAAPLGIASAQYQLVRTDNLYNPSQGFVFRSEVKSSLRAFLSSADQTFNKGTIDGLFYLPVGRSSVFATRVRAGLMLSENLRFITATQFIPPSERLYAGGANSVRGFQQNQLGSLLYLAQGVDTVKAGAASDSTYYFRTRNDTIPFRVVPVGGNALFVVNFEYRVPDIFLPRLLQYAFFMDGGDLWTRGTPGTGLGLAKMSWTPGIGIRVSTPVGPLQVNVAYNPYPQPLGAIYYDAKPDPVTHRAPLYCVSPNNTIPVYKRSDGTFVQDPVACPQAFTPLQSRNFFKRLTFTFAVGTGF
jgi:outer membrane protein assembly factor BamA